ncbi:extracellular solute-binding protein [Petrocella sp. FN5]|uniref:extracellular solute-binding protein n=1 Tax=Petrocella sp. FN5 TaxID=3032002 RepID=UPI0023DB7E0C|nr:extracellular solute-binding protein [Petrocella sp. FN5]MDF1618227.1 extracellular solute-binding protein [Petrocella sp. FN5]
MDQKTEVIKTEKKWKPYLRNSRYWILMLIVIVFLIILIRLPDEGVLSLMQKEPEQHLLKINSPLNERIIIPIIKEFQETTGIQVEYLSAGTMDLLEVLDHKEERYLMDVMWGGSKEYLNIYKDLFEPYTSIYDHEIHQSYNDEENYFLGYNLLPIVLIYNTKLVTPEEAPKTWMDVLDPRWKGKLAFVDPSTSGSAFIALSFILNLNQTGSDYNWKNAEKLLDNLNGKILAKSSEVYEGVANGDFAIGITMEEAAILYINRGEDVGIVYLEEGTPVITDSIALMKDAKNKEEAKAFIDFVLSKNVQTYMVDQFYLRSIREDVDVPMGLVPMDELNIFDASNLDTYEKKADVLKNWQDMIVMRGQEGE